MKKKNGFTTKENLVIVCLTLLIIGIVGLVIYANMNTTKKESEKKEDTPTPVVPDEPEDDIIDVTSILTCSGVSSENPNRNVFIEITFNSANTQIENWDVTTLENYEEAITEEEINEKVAEIENAGNTTTCMNNSVSTSFNVSCTLNENGINTYIQELGTTQRKEEIQRTLQTNGLSLNGEQILFSCN